MSAALKAMFAMESREFALAKAGKSDMELEFRRLKDVANCFHKSIGEAVTYLLPEFSRLASQSVQDVWRNPCTLMILDSGISMAFLVLKEVRRIPFMVVVTYPETLNRFP